MGFENGEMVVRVSDLRVGFVSRVVESPEGVRYRIRFHGGESPALEESDLASALDIPFRALQS